MAERMEAVPVLAVVAAADRVAAVLRLVRDTRVRAVLIDGPSGSGKTTLATTVVERLRSRSGPGARRRVVLVRMDDLYPGWQGLDAGSAAAHDALLRPHRLGRTGRYRRWNWASSAPSSWVRVPPEPLLVLEGCGSASRANRLVADRVVWLETEDAVRQERAFARDGEVFAPHWDDWDAQFRRYVAREGPRGAADLVLRT